MPTSTPTSRNTTSRRSTRLFFSTGDAPSYPPSDTLPPGKTRVVTKTRHGTTKDGRRPLSTGPDALAGEGHSIAEGESASFTGGGALAEEGHLASAKALALAGLAPYRTIRVFLHSASPFISFRSTITSRYSNAYPVYTRKAALSACHNLTRRNFYCVSIPASVKGVYTAFRSNLVSFHARIPSINKGAVSFLTPYVING